MKKIQIISIMLFTLNLFAEIDIEKEANSLILQGNFDVEKIRNVSSAEGNYTEIKIYNCNKNSKQENYSFPIFSRLIDLPEIGNYKIEDLHFNWQEINLSHPLNNFLPELDQPEIKNCWLPENIVQISDPVIMRGERFCQLSISPIRYNPELQQIRLIKDLQLQLTIDHSIPENPLNRKTKIHNFKKLSENKILGARSIREMNVSNYLFIGPDSIEDDIQPLLRWKEKLGFKTKFAGLSETGYSEDNIKNYLQNAYDNWTIPPEYVILIGDVTGSFVVPSFYVDGYLTPYVVTDHPYTLLDGTDYFPDIYIGRLSVHNNIELNTVINKIIQYESNPLTATNWFKKALMVSYISNWQEFYSGRETVMAVREKLLDFEYTAVDTFISPYSSSSYQLTNLINNGYSFVNYRGAGAPWYWWGGSGTLYTSSDVQTLSNGFMLPMVTSITCGGGDFAYSSDQSCFGELWLNQGSPANPKGAIGFIGPSEHDTKTPFNNANDMGIYQGITQEGLYRCGEMLLRGKMELYNNFPYCHNWGNALNSDQFYFYVYNLLGDPGLQVWTDMPSNLSYSIPDTIFSHSNFLQLEITNLLIDKSDFVVAITNQDSLVTQGTTNETGIANIPLSLTAGSYEVTVSKYGFIPETKTLAVLEDNRIVLQDQNFSSQICGTSATVAITIENTSDQSAENVQITLISDSDELNFLVNSDSLDILAEHQSYQTEFAFDISETWLDQSEIELFLEISSSLGEDSFLIPMKLYSPEYVVSDFITDDFFGNLLQNTLSNVVLELKNLGSISAAETEIEIFALTDQCEIISGVSELDCTEIGDSVLTNPPFQIHCGSAYSGELARFKLQISNADTIFQEMEYSYPIGVIDEFAPTFSDYGYIAIESADVGNFFPPVYNWIEIDPNLGGNGTLITSVNYGDGNTETIDLPFPFTYFGEIMTEISVCTNGWLAFGETNLNFFRNRNIPSGSGASSLVAPFWDHLINGEVYYFYDEINHKVIVEWSGFKNNCNFQNEIFQVILLDPAYHPTETGDGKIIFQYKEISNSDTQDNYATIGVESPDKTDGVLITFANIYPPTTQMIDDETAILFTTLEEHFVSYQDNEVTPKKPQLFQNYPNPFNPSTTISFNSITENTGDTEIIIYNLKGQKVKTLECIICDDAASTQSLHSIIWNGRDENNKSVSSGVYFYQLQVDGKPAASRKMLLMK